MEALDPDEVFDDTYWDSVGRGEPPDTWMEVNFSLLPPVSLGISVPNLDHVIHTRLTMSVSGNLVVHNPCLENSTGPWITPQTYGLRSPSISE